MAGERILIVEDDASLARYLESILGRLGYQVSGNTARGEDALEQAAASIPDLAVMDIRLAGSMDGIETAGILRERHGVPTLYLTGLNDERTLERAKLTGPFGYLLKPFQEHELHTAIEMAFYQSQTERTLRENEQWVTTMLRSIGDAVIATDKDRRITFMNPVAEELAGVKATEVTGRLLGEAVHLSDGETGDRITWLAQCEPVEALLPGPASPSILRRSDGREFRISRNAAPICATDGSITGIVVVFRDITRIYQAEEDLRKAKEDLERRVEERAGEIAKANERLREELAERKRLEQEIQTASDGEQRRIAQDLHDGVIQNLVGAGMMAQTLEVSLAEKFTPESGQAAKISEALGEAVAEIRRLIHGFRPPKLETEGLVAALEQLASSAKRLFGVSCEVEHSPLDFSMGLDKATHLYRIAQEAVSNAVKHGRAESIVISLKCQDSVAELSIADDGGGLPPHQEERGGMGLRTMRYRAGIIGALLEIKNRSEAGVTVICRFPMAES